MNSQYAIYLDTQKIGITFLEKADAPMGVVMGKIVPLIPEFGFLFLKNYLEENDLVFENDLEVHLIITRTIPGLTIINQATGVEIKGLGNQISGMNGEGFDVSIEGIAYPFYKEEFPHHVDSYH